MIHATNKETIPMNAIAIPVGGIRHIRNKMRVTSSGRISGAKSLTIPYVITMFVTITQIATKIKIVGVMLFVFNMLHIRICHLETTNTLFHRRHRIPN